MNQSEQTSHKLQTIGIREYCFSLSSYLPIFVPISVPMQVYRSVTTITHLYKPYPPPPIRERENLGSLSSIFFEFFFREIFFWNFFFEFFLQNSTRFFLWLWVFLRECIFWVKHFDRERFFFCKSGILWDSSILKRGFLIEHLLRDRELWDIAFL